MRSILPLIAFAALLIASCDDDSTSSTDDSKYPSRRDIPASLRAKCPDMTPASRASSGTTDGLQLEQNETRHITYGIYDSSGALVAVGEQDIPAVPSSDRPYIFAWNGKDASGNTMPTGVYFIFMDVYDPSGTLLQSSSNCIGYRSSP